MKAARHVTTRAAHKRASSAVCRTTRAIQLDVEIGYDIGNHKGLVGTRVGHQQRARRAH